MKANDGYSGSRVFYGPGVQRFQVGDHLVWGHDGAIVGFRAVMWYAPKERVALAVL